jgi:hypothetical protein
MPVATAIRGTDYGGMIGGTSRVPRRARAVEPVRRRGMDGTRGLMRA